MINFKRKGKLVPKYINPYKIIEWVGKVTYMFLLPTSMNCIHDHFHVSSLCKYIGDPSYMLRIKEIQLSNDLSYDERLI